MPTDDPEDRRRYDAEVEAIAVQGRLGVRGSRRGDRDRTCPSRRLARAAGLGDNPGFDLLSMPAGGGQAGHRGQGPRRGVGDVELTENEWAKACNQRDRYWLYVVFDCASPAPRLLRVQDPFGKLIVKAKGSVIVSREAIMQAAETV